METHDSSMGWEEEAPLNSTPGDRAGARLAGWLFAATVTVLFLFQFIAQITFSPEPPASAKGVPLTHGTAEPLLAAWREAAERHEPLTEATVAGIPSAGIFVVEYTMRTTNTAPASQRRDEMERRLKQGATESTAPNPRADRNARTRR